MADRPRLPAATSRRAQLTLMRRVCIAMFVGGGLTSGIGVWTTAATPHGKVWQGAVAVAFLACGAALALTRPASRRTMEAAAFGAMALLGLLVAGSQPLGMAPIFFLWPVVLLAYFSTARLTAIGFVTATTALGVGLAVNGDAPLRVDTFVGTTASVGLMAWLVASMTRNQSELRAELATAAETDPLTGLLNRRAFQPRLAGLIAEATATGNALTLVMVDLDHFKDINDTHGHDVGDTVLRHVARALTSTCRDGDLVARLGGEEFAVVLPGASTELGDVYAARAVAAMRDGPDGVEPLSASAGICALGPETTSAHDLLVHADHALYAAKAAGRGRSARWEGRALVGPPFRPDEPH